MRRALAERGATRGLYTPRSTSARAGAVSGLDSAWMLDPAEAGGGCLRNLGPHGLDLFLDLTGEEAQVTGAQISRRAHGQRVEDYASVLLPSSRGILGTVEVGNGFPRVGTDGEWKIRGARRHPHALARTAC